MNNIVPRQTNGNGQGSVNGRGLARRQMTVGERVCLAAEIATGQRQLMPSLTQIADATGISVWSLRNELKERERVEAERQAIKQRLQVQLEAEMANAQADAIAVAWEAASSTAQEAAVRTIGVADIWNVIAVVVA